MRRPTRDELAVAVTYLVAEHVQQSLQWVGARHLFPDGGDIVEYAINESNHKVIITRFFPADRIRLQQSRPSVA